MGLEVGPELYFNHSLSLSSLLLKSGYSPHLSAWVVWGVSSFHLSTFPPWLVATIVLLLGEPPELRNP